MEVLVLVSILLAIGLSVLGFVMLLRYRTFGNDKVSRVEEKINKLNNALDSCDKMIDELNKLSDYIISNVESKSVELKGLMDEAERKVSELSSKSYAVIKAAPLAKAEEKPEPKSTLLKLTGRFHKDKVENHKEKSDVEEIVPVIPASSAVNAYTSSASFTKEEKDEAKPEVKEVPFIINAITPDEKESEREEAEDKSPDDRGRMFAFVVSSKAKDVIELSNQGLDTTEIAKRLGIGKGEIELILGMKR